MLNKFKPWYKGLGKFGKIGFWTVSTIVGLSAIGAVSPSNSVQSEKPISSQEGNLSTDSSSQEEKSKVEKKTITEKEVLKYSSSTVNDSSLESGKTGIQTTGVNGEKLVTYEVTMRDGKEIGKLKKSEKVTKIPVNEVTTVGTYVAPAPTVSKPSTNCDPNYSPCVPNVSYDLDCSDISFSVRVIGTDHHRFDRDKDGLGCESN